jgi:cytoskeletal protein RodZ
MIHFLKKNLRAILIALFLIAALISAIVSYNYFIQIFKGDTNNTANTNTSVATSSSSDSSSASNSSSSSSTSSSSSSSQMSQANNSTATSSSASSSATSASTGANKSVATSTAATKYAKVIVEALNFRDSACGNPAGLVKNYGATGTVINGPSNNESCPLGRYSWYQIQYSDGTTGWSAAQYLEISDKKFE